MAALVIRCLAGLCLLAGLALLYLRWRDRARSRWFVSAGWVLAVAGLTGWTLGGSADVALSNAVTLAMTAALAVIAGHALTLPKAAKAARERTVEDDNLPKRPGYWSRVAARLLGTVVAAPAAGLMAGTLWRAYGPGDEADGLMMMATIAIAVMAGGWVWQLADIRPWRSFAGLSVAAVLIAALVYLPMGFRP
ncbi:hypothetical protein [Asticcacaulis solisilvae]|uniref:hypothetical protein n=1 Tax=Asticcacaulis solisilvae TaxID=1217274 RepID=UPI003FD6E984